MEETGKKVLLHLTGSIACYKACSLISSLVKTGYEVQCVATRATLRFVGKESLEGISRRPLLSSVFREEGKDPYPHITYTRRWADLFLVYPATAHAVARLTAGFADDLLGASFLSNNFLIPVWIAPAMNEGMLEHPATRRNLEMLASWGCRLLMGKEGRLACGDKGRGRLIDPEEVYRLVREDL